MGYGLYLYFLRLSIRGVSKTMFFLHKVKKQRWNLEQDSKIQASEGIVN